MLSHMLFFSNLKRIVFYSAEKGNPTFEGGGGGGKVNSTEKKHIFANFF